MLEKLQRELEATRKALAEAKASCAHREAEHQATTTELEQARKKIEHSHQEWIAALDVLEDPVFLHDKDFRILRCNRAYQQCAGLPFKQIIGQPYFEIFPKTHAPLRHCLNEQKKPPEIEDEEVVTDGTIYRSRSSAITDVQENYLYSIHILEDVTERKKAEATLRESKDLLRSIVEHAPIRAFWKDTDLRYLGCNTAFARDAGYSSPDELIGKTDFDMSWKEQAELYRADDKAVIDTGQAKLYYEEPQTRPDGRKVWVGTSKVPLHDAKDRIIGMLGIYQDITERKLAQQTLQEEKIFSETLIKSLPDIFFVLDPQGNFLRWSDNTANLLGFTQEEMLKANALSFVYEEDRPLVAQKLQQTFETGSAAVEARVIAQRGIRYYTFTATRIETRLGTNILGVGIDITERKKSEDAFNISHERFSTIFNQSPLGIALIDSHTGKIHEVNPRFAEIAGRTIEEMATIDWMSITHPDDLKKDLDNMALLNAGKIPGFNMDKRYLHPDGSFVWINMTIAPLKADKNVSPRHLCMIDDITERKQIQESLRQSEEKFRSLVESTSDWIWEIDRQGLYTYASPRVETLLGYQPDEVLDKSPFNFMSPEEASRVGRIMGKLIDKHEPLIAVENTCLHKDGHPVTLETSGLPFFNEQGEFSGYRGIDRDITERKRHEIEIGKTSRALSLLSRCNTLLVHASNEQEILSEICQLAVESGGYLMAWVGFAEQDENRTVRPVAQSGYEEGYLDNVNITWADSELGRGPTGTAIRTGRAVINQNIWTNPDMKPWMEAALKRGYQASIALPLTSDKQILGALTIYAVEPNAFTDEEVSLLEEMANDLAYGITALRTRKEHEQHTIVLRQSLEQSIQALAGTVESRDPYTAGHQRRVAELASAIAREMGLPDEQVNGLHLAATVHDIGKIHIPAEILSKPGRLSPIELSLVKTHAQAGYDILKNVEFPWPIADIIRQHHERQDGSGYPQGLKGEQILPEARILAVADVVESMISHRPYRPGLGEETTFDEIRQNRGRLYDPDVVDACLKLFTEKAYQLPPN